MTGRLLTSEADIAALVKRMRSCAVLGIKTEAQADQPAFYVPQYIQSAGVKVYPVPVYYPDVTRILGQPVRRAVAAIGERVDVVDVFRKPSDLMPHLDDLVAAKPGAVWLQSGIRSDAFARALCDADIDVVQDRCLMVDVRRYR